MKITSLQNEKVKHWVKLQDKKYRDETNTFLIEGDHLVKEAFRYGLIKEIITLEEIDIDLPHYVVTNEIMKKISTQVSPSKVVAVCEKKEEKEVLGSVVLLDAIQDPGNLGTIIRSAVAFGIKNIVLSEGCVDLYNPKVIRSTEGMLFHVNIVRKNIHEFLPLLKETHFIIGTDVTGGVKVCDLSICKDFCLIIGSEGQGMSEFCRLFCESLVYIPMNSVCESLNASVSASILMYELNRSEYEK